MYLKLLIYNLNLEFAFEERIVSVYIFYGHRTIINYEKYFPLFFRCVVCNKRVEYIGQKLKLCEDHYEDCMEYFKKKMS